MVEYDRLVLGCMDSRFHEPYEKMDKDGKTIFVRNAGANVATSASTIKHILKEYPGIKRITIAAHTDCGAMGIVEKALNGSDFGEEAEKCLISEFKIYNKKSKIGSRQELEKLNPELQKVELKKMLGKSFTGEIDTVLLRLEDVVLPDTHGNHDKELLVMCPGKATYRGTCKKSKSLSPNTYVIQEEDAEVVEWNLGALKLLKPELKRVSFFGGNGNTDIMKTIMKDVEECKNSKGLVLDYVE